MGVAIKPRREDIKVSGGTVNLLTKYKRADTFRIPYDTYNGSEEIQQEVVGLLEYKQPTDFGTIGWAMRVEGPAGGKREVIVYMVMN